MTDKSLALIGELESAGVLSSVGLKLTEEITYERYEAMLFLLGSAHESMKWAVGDALVYGEKVFGEDVYQASEALRMSPQTRDRYRRVADRIPIKRRRHELTWSHHFAVCQLPPRDQDDWLDKAVVNRYSSQDLKELIKTPKEIELIAGEEDESGFVTCPACGETFEP